MDKRLVFRPGQSLGLSRLVLSTVFFGAYAVLLAVAPETPVLLAVLVGVLLALEALVFTLSPFLTEHWLTRSRLILRQGWYFRAVLPLADLEFVRPIEPDAPSRVPLGIHRPLGKASLYVTGGRTGLVVARLRSPRRFWQAFGLEATEIVFDISDREGFLRAVGERRDLLTPVEA